MTYDELVASPHWHGQPHDWLVCEICRMGYKRGWSNKRIGSKCGDWSSHPDARPCHGRLITAPRQPIK